METAGIIKAIIDFEELYNRPPRYIEMCQTTFDNIPEHATMVRTEDPVIVPARLHGIPVRINNNLAPSDIRVEGVKINPADRLPSLTDGRSDSPIRNNLS